METADEQTGEMEKHHTNAIHKTYRNRQSESLKHKRKSYQGKARTLKNNQCGLCGGSYPHVGDCPAQGKKCHNCGKLNHFSRVCRSKKKQLVNPPKHHKNTHQARAMESNTDSDGMTSAEAISLTCDRSDEEYLFGLPVEGPTALP